MKCIENWGARAYTMASDRMDKVNCECKHRYLYRAYLSTACISGLLHSTQSAPLPIGGCQKWKMMPSKCEPKRRNGQQKLWKFAKPHHAVRHDGRWFGWGMRNKKIPYKSSDVYQSWRRLYMRECGIRIQAVNMYLIYWKKSNKWICTKGTNNWSNKVTSKYRASVVAVCGGLHAFRLRAHAFWNAWMDRLSHRSPDTLLLWVMVAFLSGRY